MEGEEKVGERRGGGGRERYVEGELEVRRRKDRCVEGQEKVRKGRGGRGKERCVEGRRG